MQSILTSKNILTHRPLESILAYTARLGVLSPARVTLEYDRQNAVLLNGALRYVAVRYVALRYV